MITPVILCGGSGTRLWPLSRKSYPKQFVPLMGELTLFQATAQRLSGKEFKAPLVLTNSDFRFIVTEQLCELGVYPEAVIIEPESRNTAPAILAAAFWLEKTDPDGLMLIAPSDHVIDNTQAFYEAVQAGVENAKSGQLVTFGVKPTYAEIGYGYLELTENPTKIKTKPYEIKRFVEKPNAGSAKDMVVAGNFLWNAGIFLFSVKNIIQAYTSHAPDLLLAVRAAVDRGKPDLSFFRLDPDAWSSAAHVSIDHAIMEQANNLSVIPLTTGWSDLGGWDAVWRESQQDKRGVATFGSATAIDCDNTLLRSEDSALEVVGIGLNNIITVAMPDAVLVADASRAQDVKIAVSTLTDKKIKQATTFPMSHRPWGWFENLVIGDRFQVKRITVRPGAALSLQNHYHRSEHWIVVEGIAKVTINDSEQIVSENQSVYIPLGAIHRMENPGKLPLVIIEVQTGSYLGEDDIIRHEDDYARE